MAELERQAAVRLRLARAPLERFDDTGAGAPGDVKPRHRIAMAHRIVTAALGPADDREDPMAHRAQPSAFLAGRERHIGFRPAPRPKIFIAVEARRPHPVLQREIVAVLDAEPALFGAIDQKQSAERPEGLAAKALFAFLIDHDDAFAGVGDFGCGDKAREACTDHDYVCIVSHRVSPDPRNDRSPRPKPRSTANGRFGGGGAAGECQLFHFGTLGCAEGAACLQHLI